MNTIIFSMSFPMLFLVDLVLLCQVYMLGRHANVTVSVVTIIGNNFP